MNLLKYEKYNNYTQAEKRNYKMLGYIKDIYSLLEINQFYKKNISNSTLQLYNELTAKFGNKRSKNKDAIIILCFKYFSKKLNLHFDIDGNKSILQLTPKCLSKAQIYFREYGLT